jgi:ribonuclease P protein component
LLFVSEVEMIARDLRLRNPRDFERVRSEGRNRSNRLLAIAVSPNGSGSNRYGFAAGRGIGSAVQRNRAKRVMREATRHLHPRIAPGHDIIFVARNRVNRTTTLDEISRAMVDLLRRSGLLVEDGSEGETAG